ncbi:MAG: GTP-binding protein [Thermohalobaculum sp.]|nr:GTP-binding protein [Thermohalobaculum sp.]
MTDAVPVTILTGFLGAGKTTLLARLLADPQGVRFGVLVNDFGEINIDAELVAETAADRVSLANGCVCCSIRDDLVAAVRSLLDAPAPPQHLLIEASGVSRPLAIADALSGEPRARLDGIFCVIDAAHFEGLGYADSELAMDQAFGADLVLLNKADLVDAGTLARIEATLRAAMPRLRTVPTRHGEVPRALLFGPEPGPREPAACRAAGCTDPSHRHDHGADHDHGAHAHDAEFESWSWSARGPIREAAFRAAVAAFPPGLLRAKGILDLDGRRAVFQLVGKRREIVVGDGPPPPESRLVAIARRGGLDAATLADLLSPASHGSVD